MWDRSSAWFDLSIALGVLAVGGILFGRFEQHKSRARRVGKVVVSAALYVWIAQAGGRAYAAGFLAVFGVLALVVHAWWLPKHGINGWTAEPYDAYLSLITKKRGRGSQ